MPQSNPPSGGVNPGGASPTAGPSTSAKAVTTGGGAVAAVGGPGGNGGKPAAKNRKITVKIIVAAVGALLLVVLVVAALLPTILSTGFVRRVIARQIDDMIPGSLQINEWSLSWGKGQTLHGLVLRDPGNGDVIQVGAIEAPDLSLWKFLWGSRDIGTLRIEDAVLMLVQDRDGTNLDAALGRSIPDASQQSKPTKKSSEPFTLPPGVSGKIEMVNTRVVYSARAMTPLEIAVDSTFDAVDPRKVSFSFTGGTRQGSERGSFKSQGQLTDLFDALGRLQQDKAHVDISFEGQGLPVTAVDRFFRVRRKLVEALGPKLDVRLDSMLGPVADVKADVTGSLKDMAGQVIVRSESVSLRCVASLADGKLSLAEPAGLSLRLTPERWSDITTPGRRGFGFRRGPIGDRPPGPPADASSAQTTRPARAEGQLPLESRPQPWAPPIGETFDMKLAVTRLSVPLGSDFAPDLAGSSIAARLEMTPVTLVNVRTGGDSSVVLPEVRLSDFVASIEAVPLAKGMSLTVRSQAQLPDQAEPGLLSADVNLTDLFTKAGALNTMNVRADVTASTQRFPLALADHFARSRGALAAMLGPTLDMTLKANLAPTPAGPEGTFKLDASSLNLKAGVNGQASKGSLAFDTGSTATLEINPANFAFLQRAIEHRNPRSGVGQLAVVAPATLRLSVDRMVVPLAPASPGDSAPPSFGMTSASLGLSMSSLALRGVQGVDSLSIDHASLRVESARIDKTIDLTLNLSMIVPSASDAAVPAAPGGVSVSAQLSDVVDSQGLPTPEAFSFKASGAVKSLPIGLIDTLAHARGSLVATLGPTIDVNLRNVKRSAINSATDAMATSFAVEARSANLTAVVEGVSDPSSLTLTNRSKLALKVTPEAVSAGIKSAASTDDASKPMPLRMVSPANVNLSVAEFVYPAVPMGSPRPGRLDVAMTIDRVELADILGAPGSSPSATGVALRLRSSNLDESLNVTAGGELRAGSDAGKFDFSADVKRPLMATSHAVSGQVSATAIPVSLLDALGQQGGGLVALLGTRIDRVKFTFASVFPLDTQARKTKQLFAEAIVESPALKVNLAGQVQPGGVIALRNDGLIQYTLTPEGFAFLRGRLARQTPAATTTPDGSPTTTTERANGRGKPARVTPAPPEIALLSPVKFTLNLTQAQFGTQASRPTDTSDSSGPQSSASDDEPGVALNPAQTNLELELTADRLVLARAGDSVPLSVEAIKASIVSQNLTQAIDISLAAGFDAPDGNTTAPANRGTLSCKSQIVGLFKPDGSLDTADARLTTDASLTSLPVAAVDRLTLMEGQLVGVLGQSAAGTIKGKLSAVGEGSLDVVVDSQNARLSAPLSIDSGVLGLRQDLIATLKVTPELSKTVLKKMTGWVEAEGSDKPIELKILAQDFSVPLTAFDIAKVRANGELDMGTLRLSANSPVIAALFTVKDVVFGLLQQGGEARLLSLITGLGDTLSGGRGVTAPATNAVFTPMNFQIASGVASYDKLSMTVEQLVVRFKGDVNLQSKANNLVMTIVGDSIAKSSRAEVLTFMRGRDIVIPVGGTYDKPKPDERVIVETLPKLLSGNGSGNGKNALQNTADSVGKAIQGLPGVGELLGPSGKEATKDTGKDATKDATKEPARDEANGTAAHDQPANPKPRSGLGGLLDQVLPPSSDNTGEQAPKPKKQPKNADKSGDKASEKASEKSGKKATTKPATDAVER